RAARRRRDRCGSAVRDRGASAGAAGQHRRGAFLARRSLHGRTHARRDRLMATTNTEIYRKFQGELRPASLRFLPLAHAAIRTLTKRKLPLLILYAPPVIATVIFSFVVYLRFSLDSGETPSVLGGGSNP